MDGEQLPTSNCLLHNSLLTHTHTLTEPQDSPSHLLQEREQFAGSNAPQTQELHGIQAGQGMWWLMSCSTEG